MKTKIFYVFVFLGLFVSSSVYSFEINRMTIRPYGDFGLTFVNADSNISDNVNYSIGSQIFIGESTENMIISFGFDLGYSRLYNIYSSTPDKSMEYFRTVFVKEITIKGDIIWPTFQVGVGALWSFKDVSDSRFLVHCAVGSQIPISDYVAIPLLLRFDVIFFGERYVGSFSAMTGVSIGFDI